MKIGIPIARPVQDNVINFIKMVSGMRYEARMSKDIFDHINAKIDREKISTLIGISNQRYSYFTIDSRLINRWKSLYIWRRLY